MSISGVKREFLLDIPIDYVEEGNLKEIIWALTAAVHAVFLYHSHV